MTTRAPVPGARRDTVGVAPEGLAQAELDALVRYWDIIDLPAFEPKRHPRQPADVRAAQFSPFAALVGYEDEVAEVARTTEERLELGEDARAELGEATRRLAAELEAGGHPVVTLTWFVPDVRKRGGTYETVRESARYVDVEQRALVLRSGMAVPLDSIIELQVAGSCPSRETPPNTDAAGEAPGMGAPEEDTCE